MMSCPARSATISSTRSLADEVGATWLLTTYRMDLNELCRGPAS